MRVVLDTNVVVSALLPGNTRPPRIMSAWYAGRFQWVTSPAILREIDTVLARPWFRARLRIDDEGRAVLIEEMREGAVIVDPPKTLNVIEGDPSDNRILEAAIAGEASYIISGDRDLLDLGSHEGIDIVTPARFLVLLAMA